MIASLSSFQVIARLSSLGIEVHHSFPLATNIVGVGTLSDCEHFLLITFLSLMVVGYLVFLFSSSITGCPTVIAL